MNVEEFAAIMRQHVVEENTRLYAEMLRESSSEAAPPSNAYGKALWELAAMGPEQHQRILVVMRQVTIDTIATLLAALDGTSLLSAFPGDFTLTYDGTPLERDLSDEFLRQIEEEEAESAG